MLKEGRAGKGARQWAGQRKKNRKREIEVMEGWETYGRDRKAGKMYFSYHISKTYSFLIQL